VVLSVFWLCDFSLTLSYSLKTLQSVSLKFLNRVCFEQNSVQFAVDHAGSFGDILFSKLEIAFIYIQTRELGIIHHNLGEKQPSDTFLGK